MGHFHRKGARGQEMAAEKGKDAALAQGSLAHFVEQASIQSAVQGLGRRRCARTLSDDGQEVDGSRMRLNLLVDFKKDPAHTTSPLARSGMSKAARLDTPHRRANAPAMRPASRGSKVERRRPTKPCIRATLETLCPDSDICFRLSSTNGLMNLFHIGEQWRTERWALWPPRLAPRRARVSSCERG